MATCPPGDAQNDEAKGLNITHESAGFSSEGRLLNESLMVIKDQAQALYQAMEAGLLREILKRSSLLIAELRTSALPAKLYYELYSHVFTELQHLYRYFLDRRRHRRKLQELYESVQHAGNVVPRLYLLTLVGVACIKQREIPAQEVLDDLVELSKGVQHPIRGLFLRFFLIQMAKDVLPDISDPVYPDYISPDTLSQPLTPESASDADKGAEPPRSATPSVLETPPSETSVAKRPLSNGEVSFNFLYTNCFEAAKLWARIQYQSPAKERAQREMERYSLRSLVGVNISQMAQLRSMTSAFYKHVAFPRLQTLIASGRDAMAQEYLLECVVQAFHAECHLATLPALLQCLCTVTSSVNVPVIFSQVLVKIQNHLLELTHTAQEEQPASSLSVTPLATEETVKPPEIPQESLNELSITSPASAKPEACLGPPAPTTTDGLVDVGSANGIPSDPAAPPSEARACTAGTSPPEEGTPQAQLPPPQSLFQPTASDVTKQASVLPLSTATSQDATQGSELPALEDPEKTPLSCLRDRRHTVELICLEAFATLVNNLRELLRKAHAEGYGSLPPTPRRCPPTPSKASASPPPQSKLTPLNILNLLTHFLQFTLAVFPSRMDLMESLFLLIEPVIVYACSTPKENAADTSENATSCSQPVTPCDAVPSSLAQRDGTMATAVSKHGVLTAAESGSVVTTKEKTSPVTGAEPSKDAESRALIMPLIATLVALPLTVPGNLGLFSGSAYPRVLAQLVAPYTSIVFRKICLALVTTQQTIQDVNAIQILYGLAATDEGPKETGNGGGAAGSQTPDTDWMATQDAAAQIVHLIQVGKYAEETDIEFSMLTVARDCILSRHSSTYQYTVPSLTFKALQLFHRIHIRELALPLPPTIKEPLETSPVQETVQTDKDNETDPERENLKSFASFGSHSSTGHGDTSPLTPQVSGSPATEPVRPIPLVEPVELYGDKHLDSLPHEEPRTSAYLSEPLLDQCPTAPDPMHTAQSEPKSISSVVSVESPGLPLPAISSKRALQLVHMTCTEMMDWNAEVAYTLMLRAGESVGVAERREPGKFFAILSEFLRQALVCYEELLTENKARVHALSLVVPLVNSFGNLLDPETMDTLAEKLTRHGAKLLRRSEQCAAILQCSRLFWNPSDRSRCNITRIQECLQRSLKVALASLQYSLNDAHLLVDILETYLYYFDRIPEEISPQAITNLLSLCAEQLTYAQNVHTERAVIDITSGAQAHLTNVIHYIRKCQESGQAHYLRKRLQLSKLIWQVSPANDFEALMQLTGHYLVFKVVKSLNTLLYIVSIFVIFVITQRPTNRHWFKLVIKFLRVTCDNSLHSLHHDLLPFGIGHAPHIGMNGYLGYLPPSDAFRPEPDETLGAVPILKFSGHTDTINRVRFSSYDCRYLASAGADGQLRIYDLETSQCIGSARNLHSKGINDVAWDGHGQHIYTASSDGTVACVHVANLPGPHNWSLPGNAPSDRGIVARVRHHPEHPVTAHSSSENKTGGISSLLNAATAVAAPNTSGQYFLTGGYNELLRKWDTRKFGVIADVRAHDGPIMSLDISHDDTLVVSASLDGYARLWETTDFRSVGTFNGAEDIPLCHALFLPPYGKQLLCIPLESHARIWNLPLRKVQYLVGLPPEGSVFQGPSIERGAQHLLSQFNQMEPPIPSVSRPLDGNTPIEFLTSPGPSVFGCCVSDRLVLIPQVRRQIPSVRYPVYHQHTADTVQNPPVANGIGIWDINTRGFVGHLTTRVHQFCDVTSVAAHLPPNTYTLEARSGSHTALFATSSDYPDMSTVIWMLKNWNM